MDAREWEQLAETATFAAFAARVGVGLFMAVAPSGEELPRTFETVAVSGPPSAMRAGIAEIVAVGKAPGNPYPERISLGRARNCDVVLADPSVSKLHAHLHLRQNRTLLLTDLGSHNGTRVNGQRVSPGVPTLVSWDDLLHVGRVEARFFDTRGMYELLRELRFGS